MLAKPGPCCTCIAPFSPVTERSVSFCNLINNMHMHADYVGTAIRGTGEQAHVTLIMECQSNHKEQC